ncbi:stage III sporulation protein AF [Phosphitispora sp. TUW77]|uniref:stage III sporulation protein AF n=1 Tax=Phosphitispora sp. TUW77 TaxID=3152361 RepID=UPI003AB795FD
METLRIMVKSILIIILMTAFLEIVLPRSDIKRYINLIIGLFIIIAVLNPILAIFNTGFDFEVFSAVPEGINGDTETLINKGREISRTRDSRVAADYKEKLEKQVKSISGFYRDVSVADVQVDMVADAEAPDFGKINKIILWTDVTAEKSEAEESGGMQGEVKIDGLNVDEVDINIDDADVNIEPEKDAAENLLEPMLGNPDNSRGLREMVADFYGLSAEQIEIKN